MKKLENINVGKIRVNTPNIELSKKQKPQIDTFEIKDFKNPASEALGRSQVPSKIDNLENNILFMLKNPDQVKQANAFFDQTYETLKAKGDENAYEKSTRYMDAFKEEFMK